MRGKRGSPKGEDFRPTFHPAGRDGELREVVQDVRVGRWLAMRELLARTGDHWALRTSRSQVLASVAAGTTVVEAWLAEEGEHPDARMMQARVATARAVQASVKGHARAGELVLEASQSARMAAGRVPADPVPWVCLLALAQIDTVQGQPQNRQPAWEMMLPDGPWGVLAEVYARDRFNREAYHRMLQFFHAAHAVTPGAATDFARWVVSWAPPETSLRLLPLYARVEQYRRRRDSGAGADPLLHRQWAAEPVLGDVRRALTWFDGPDRARSALDLNHLAHALWAAHLMSDAARVFLDLGPHITQMPWAQVGVGPGGGAEAATRMFLTARGQCLGALPRGG